MYLADLDRQGRDAPAVAAPAAAVGNYGLIARPESWPAFGRQLHLPGGSHHPRLRSEASDGRLVLVAANADDRPVAYIDLEPDGHIDRVFCAPEAAGQGIASRLYDAVEAAAREQGIRSLFTEASELARRLFERKGFVVVERQDLVIRGVAIHNYRMAKALDLTAPHLTWPGWPDLNPRRGCPLTRFRALRTTVHHRPLASLTSAGRRPAVARERPRTGVNETQNEPKTPAQH